MEVFTSYEVKQGNIFGRIGKGIGQGLSEQVPKEIERARLSSGLKSLEKEKDLDPTQFFTRAISLPGITPQIVQSLGELAKQRGQAAALGDFKKSEQEASKFPERQPSEPRTVGENVPSITTRTPIEATTTPYIPKTLDEIYERAGERYNQNPAFYKNDPQNAINAAIQEDAQEQSINAALQGQRKGEQDVQNKIETGLQNQRQALGVKVPDNVYSSIEDKAINAVKPKREGGEGLTEHQAKKKYGNELDAISRDYESLNTVGRFSMLARSPTENKKLLKSIRQKFIERGDQENLADSYIADNGLSPSKAYYLAYPVSENKELNNSIVKLPKLRRETDLEKYELPEVASQVRKKTLDISKKLAPLLGKNGSPLSVAEELKVRGYDPDVWLDYIRDNRKKLDLTESQGRQLDKPRNFLPTMTDLWLFQLSGIDELMEQE